MIYTLIKFYSIVIIVLIVSFVLLFGDLPRIKDSHKGKLNFEFKKNYPQYYKFLNIIGFRSIVYAEVDYDYKDR